MPTSMTPDAQSPHQHALGGSSGCASCAACPLGDPEQCEASSTAPFRGATLVGAAAFYFLFPVVCAMVGAACAGSGTDRRSLAALLGFALGLGLAAGVARRWTRRLGFAEPPAAVTAAGGAEGMDQKEQHHG